MVINRKINRRQKADPGKAVAERKFLKFLFLFRVEPHIGPRRESWLACGKKKGKRKVP